MGKRERDPIEQVVIFLIVNETRTRDNSFTGMAVPVNDWLKERDGKIRVTRVLQSLTEREFVITIFYKELCPEKKTDKKA